MQSSDRTQAVAICRSLGAEEHIYWLHDRANPFHFALTAQISGKFSVHQLQQALTLIQQRHPLLRVSIAVDEAGQPWFVEDCASIPLRVVQRQSQQQWQREVFKLQAIYGPVVRTGVKSDRLVGVATLGNQLFFTLATSESVISQFSFQEYTPTQSKTLHEEAIYLLSEAIK